MLFPDWTRLSGELRPLRVRLRLARRLGYRLRRSLAGALERLEKRGGPPVARGIREAGRFLRRGLRLLLRFRPSSGVAILLVAGGAAVAGGLYARCGIDGCPDVGRLVSFQPGGAAVLLDRNGTRFADFSPVDHAVVALDSLPEWVPAAFVAVEDRRFLEHGGVDWLRVAGAMAANLREGRMAQGSSTIPMQLSRTLFPQRIRREDRTLTRKLLEVRMAGEIEDRFSKDEILELYLNHIYLGGTLHGVQAASLDLFGKDATRLAVHEAALLAALPRAPAHYDPRSRAEAAHARRDLVITLMEEQGRISPEAAAQARAAPLGVRESRDPGAGESVAPYFVRQVRDLLEEELGGRIHQEPLRIHTTLDLEAQNAAEAELQRQLGDLDRGVHGRLRRVLSDSASAASQVQGAVVLMDAATGDVRAWVGGRDFRRAPFDRVRLTRRQAGSVFKPFVYAAALEQGRVASQPVLDAPYRPGGDDDEWEPRNYSGDLLGRMSLREALVRSQNIPAVRLAHDVGSRRVADFVERSGFAEEAPPSPVAALGVTAVSPLEVAEAYSAFVRDGQRVAPRLVTKVEDAQGRVVWSAPVRRTEVTSPAVAFVVTDMLREAVEAGTGTGVRSGGYRGPAAGKTGTTDGATDAWFAGYTPQLVGVVWLGFDGRGALPVGASGGSLAAPVWGRILSRLDHEWGAEPWPAPPRDVHPAQVDPSTGMVLRSGCRPRYGDPRTEYFIVGTEPGTICPRGRSRGLLGRLEVWFGGLFDGGREEPIPGEPDPELGVPVLEKTDLPGGVRSER